MDRLKVLNDLNEFSITNESNKIINDLNILLLNPEENQDLIMMIINNGMLFGFDKYLKFDYLQFSDADKLSLIMGCFKSKQFNYLNIEQLSLLDEIKNNDKMLISAPTSFGKTSLVNEFLICNYQEFDNVIYIVPTNSLIEELYIKLLKLNRKFDLNYKISTIPKIDYFSRNLLILTPERFLMFNSIYNDFKVDLLVMDEMYKIVNARNRYVSDVVNNRSYKFRKSLELVANYNSKCIFLSPYTYCLTTSMENFTNKYGIESIVRKTDYINHELHCISTQKEFNKFFNIDKSSYLSDDNVPTKTIKILKGLIGKQNIVYIPNSSTASEIIDNCESECGILNKNDRFDIFYNHLCQNYTVENLQVWEVIKGLEKGIGIYMSPIPRYIKKEIIRLFNDKVISCLLVTTSFVEGVNSNAENIIITSVFTAKSVKLENIDLLNVMGRAGRFGESPIGNILAINKNIYNILDNARKTDIFLNNPNYEKSNEIRDDYEIDMIEDEFLNESELNRKKEIIKLQNDLDLSNKELNIALNVPKLWKLILYSHFESMDNNEIIKCKKLIDNIVSDDRNDVAESLETIFNILKFAFEIKDINIFQTKLGEIKPFSSNGSFIWKGLYKLHSFSSIKEILYYKKQHIQDVIDSVVKNYYINNDKERLARVLSDDKKWVLGYINSDISINDSKVYNDTFKFISDVMQYKIPYYLNFFVSIYKLFVTKNKVVDINPDEINPYKIAMFFENGMCDAVDQDMMDYGLPNELIKVISDNKIIVNKKLDVDKLDFIDEYQKLMLKEFIEVML